MCLRTLPVETLDNLKKFEYKSTNDSIFYSYFLSPCLNYFINFIPKCIAPNLMTLLSLAFNIASLIVTIVDAGDNFDKRLRSSTCYIQAACHFLYILLDNLDGKQARRTKTSSPFGMLLDHGSDVFTNIIVCFNVHHLVRAGHDGFTSVFIYFALYLGFYTLTYEEYALGELHLWYFNGADEGNLIVALGALYGGISNNRYWRNTILNFKNNELILFIIFILSVNGLVITLYHIYQRRGYRRIIRGFIDWLMFYPVFLVPILFILFNNNFYDQYTFLFGIVISLIFARLTIDLQIKIVLNQTVTFGFDLIVCNIILLGSIFIKNRIALLFIFSGVSIVLGTQLAMIIAIRGIEILNYLNIRLLCIPTEKTEAIQAVENV